MLDNSTRRFLIATGTTRYANRPDVGDRPEITAEVDRILELFTTPGRSRDGGLGYRTVPGFRCDLPTAELRAKLRAFLTSPERHTDDVLVFYYSGHGEVDDSGEFLFLFPDTTDDIVGTGVPAGELARWLLVGTPVQRLLIILDTCHAGAAGSAMAARAISALGRLGGLAGRPQLAILAATRPREQALTGGFTQALARAIRHRASGGHEPRFLPLDAVTDVINADPAKPASQHAQLLSQGEAIAEFFPNPRYDQWLRGLDLRTQLDHEQRRERDREFADHVLPRAQGLDAPQEGLWLFTGRHAVLRDLSTWLRDIREDGATRVVTGDPGSGKSAVLARLTVLARPEHLRKVPRLDQLPPETLPPRESIDVFIHARGQTGDQVLAALCSAAGVEAERPGELLAALADRARPFVAVIDALDEATDPDHLTERILAPLIRGAPHSKLRLALGTRRHLLDRLGGPTDCLNLDSERYADPASVRAYVRSCLLDLVPDSPYRRCSEAVVQAVAEAVGEAAGRSFLVALITGRSLAMRTEVANPYDGQWRASLPRLAADAMRLDLDQRLGTQADKARDLLRPLAYALGSGLPWEDFWAPLASALGNREYTNADLDWLVRQAGFYVVEGMEGIRSVYRLYHEALAEHLRSYGDEREIHRAVVRFLTERTPRIDGRPDWAQSHPYTRTHLVTHAAISDDLDRLVVDPAFLLSAEHAPLLAALPSTSSAEARAAAQAYRRTIKHLRTKPPSEHASYLELAAKCYRANVLSTRIDTQLSSRPWRAVWTQWVPPSRRSVLYGHNGPVRAVAVGELDGRPVIVSGSDDETARVWDMATGTPIGQPFAEHQGSVRAVTIGRLDERLVVASGGQDYTVRLWDLATGLPVRSPLLGHQHFVRGVSMGEVDDRPVLVTGSYDNTVRVWDLTNGTPVGKTFTGHHGGIVAVAATKWSWRPVAVSAAADGTTRVWDLMSGKAVRTLSSRLRSPVVAMAVAELDQRVLLATSAATGFSSILQVWDLASGSPVDDPVVHTGSVARSLAVGQVEGRLIIVSGHDDGTIRAWDQATRVPLGQPFTGHEGVVYTITFAQLDDLPVVISGGDDRTIRVWDLAGGPTDTTALRTHLGGLRAIAIGGSRDRPVLASGSDDRTVRPWDPDTGRPIGEPLIGHTDRVRAIAAGEIHGSPVVVSGGDDRTIRLWDPRTGQQLAPSPLRHGAAIRAVTLTESNGRPILVSGAHDNSVRAWDATTGEPLTDPAAAYLYPVLAVAVGRATGHVITLDDAMWAPAPYRISYKQTSDSPDEGLAIQFVSVDGETMLATGDRQGTLRLWHVSKPRRDLPRRLRSHLNLAKEIRGAGAITTLAQHPDRSLTIARIDTVEITEPDGTGHTIQLDAKIAAMTFINQDTLVVATKQGLVALALPARAD